MFCGSLLSQQATATFLSKEEESAPKNASLALEDQCILVLARYFSLYYMGWARSDCIPSTEADDHLL